MKGGNDITEELREMGSTLADMPRTVPYTVPAGYFEQLPESMLLAATEEQPAFAQMHNPLSVPEGYFDTLPLQMLQAAKAADIDTTSKVPATTVTRLNTLPQIRWAAAAAVAIIVCIGGYITFSSAGTTAPERILSSVPGTEIKDYIAHRYGLDPNTIISAKEVNSLHVDNKDIEAYLDETGWD